MGFLIALGVVILLIFLFALLMDLQDRRRGRKSRVRITSWLTRQGSFNVANSPEGYAVDAKGVGSTYSTESWRESGEPRKPLND